jgi:guanylate kinase
MVIRVMKKSNDHETSNTSVIMAKGTLFVISAPSGAGKTTLINAVRPLFPHILYSVSYTTRPPRPGEIEGVSYFFVKTDQFERMIKSDEFLEWKKVHGNYYGTPRGPVTRALAAGRKMILDIDVQGAMEVFARVPGAVGIFITVPDSHVLEDRLRKRGTDSEETISLRMANATVEIEAADKFDYTVVNNDLAQAVKEMTKIIGEASGCESPS